MDDVGDTDAKTGDEKKECRNNVVASGRACGSTRKHSSTNSRQFIDKAQKSESAFNSGRNAPLLSLVDRSIYGQYQYKKWQYIYK